LRSTNKNLDAPSLFSFTLAHFSLAYASCLTNVFGGSNIAFVRMFALHH